MNVSWKNRMPLVAGVVLIVVALVLLARSQPVQAERAEAAAGSPRYTVVETQGFNLLVTDNAANKLYYYATDKDAPVGSTMKLRASLDLTQVGREELKLTGHRLEKSSEKEGK